jgi:hypothetical protein
MIHHPCLHILISLQIKEGGWRWRSEKVSSHALLICLGRRVVWWWEEIPILKSPGEFQRVRPSITIEDTPCLAVISDGSQGI